MADRYDIAIIGSGPGGKSAAVRAAKKGLSHILLEKTSHLSDTIYKYQRGKRRFCLAGPIQLQARGLKSCQIGAESPVVFNDQPAFCRGASEDIRTRPQNKRTGGEDEDFSEIKHDTKICSTGREPRVPLRECITFQKKLTIKVLALHLHSP